jgi:hypothetical protein
VSKLLNIAEELEKISDDAVDAAGQAGVPLAVVLRLSNLSTRASGMAAGLRRQDAAPEHEPMHTQQVRAAVARYFQADEGGED